MQIFEEIMQAYPNLNVDVFQNWDIVLRDDSDGVGAYIEAWNLDRSVYPIPKSLSIGKPQEQQE